MNTFFKSIFVASLLFWTLEANAESVDSHEMQKAKKGDVCAQVKIGYQYTLSQGGLRQDYQKAIEWYTKAANTKCDDEKCKQCQRDAFPGLASLYEKKVIDREKAFYWSKKAAESSAQSRYFTKMAEYYIEGEFVKQDYEKAYFWSIRGKYKNETSNSFIEEIKSHLTPEQIEKIDEQNEEYLQQLVQKQRDSFADMMDMAHLGFNPNAAPAEKANSRLAFELGLNKSHYDMEGVKKLIAMGALSNSPYPNEMFLHSAIDKNDLELLDLLVKNVNIEAVDEGNFLHRAIGKGHTDLVLELIEAGADVSKVSESNSTPLMVAAGKGDLKVVKALIEAGVDVNQYIGESYKRRDALFEAILARHYHVVDYLLKAGAEKNQVHYDSFRTPFSYSDQDIKRCPQDTKTCPDKSVVKRTGEACEFAACPELKKYEPVKAIKGTFSEIDTELSSKAVFILNNGTKEEKDRIIEEVKSQPEKYNPAVLLTMSRVLFSRIEDEEAAFWYMAGWLRKSHDILICENQTSKKKRAGYYYMVQQNRPYAELNPEVMRSLLERVLEWDRTTSYDYDVRWVAIGGGLHDNKLTDQIPEGLCIPENKRDEAREFSRKEYAAEFARFVEGFDYRAKPEEPKYLSRDEFKELLGKAEAGDADAQNKIATVTLTHAHKEFLDGDSKAFKNKWLSEAAKQGHIAAMSQLGSAYISGYGVPIPERESKIKEGMQLLIEAGNKGSFTAYEALGNYYMRKDDPVEAYAWFAMAEHVLQKKHPNLRVFPAKKRKAKLEATLPEDVLKKAKAKAQEYINKHDTQ